MWTASAYIPRERKRSNRSIVMPAREVPRGCKLGARYIGACNRRMQMAVPARIRNPISWLHASTRSLSNDYGVVRRPRVEWYVFTHTYIYLCFRRVWERPIFNRAHFFFTVAARDCCLLLKFTRRGRTSLRTSLKTKWVLNYVPLTRVFSRTRGTFVSTIFLHSAKVQKIALRIWILHVKEEEG